jgi:hypothetical protein
MNPYDMTVRSPLSHPNVPREKHGAAFTTAAASSSGWPQSSTRRPWLRSTRAAWGAPRGKRGDVKRNGDL